MEGPRRPEHHRQGEHDEQPVPGGEAQLWLEGQYQPDVHEGQGQQDGDDETASQHRDASLCLDGQIDVRQRSGGVADILDGRDGVLDVDTSNRRPLGGEVDACMYAVNTGQALFDGVGARRAGHPADLELDRWMEDRLVVTLLIGCHRGHGRFSGSCGLISWPAIRANMSL